MGWHLNHSNYQNWLIDLRIDQSLVEKSKQNDKIGTWLDVSTNLINEYN